MVSEGLQDGKMDPGNNTQRKVIMENNKNEQETILFLVDIRFSVDLRHKCQSRETNFIIGANPLFYRTELIQIES